MHRQAGTEKELMEWFDKQNSERKWRISAYLIKSRQPIAEAFRFLKNHRRSGLPNSLGPEAQRTNALRKQQET